MKSFEEYRNFYVIPSGGGGFNPDDGGEEVNEPLFPPKTRKQFYEAIIAGFDVELPKIIGKVVAKDTNGDPIENISLSFTAEEEDGVIVYYAQVGHNRLGQTGHESDVLAVEVNGTEIEPMPETLDGMDSGSIYYSLSISGNIVISSLTEPIGEFTVSAYWPVEVDMTKLAPKTNKEKYLAKMAGLYDDELPEPKTAEEYYLYAIAHSKDTPVNPSDGDSSGK